MKIIWAFAFSSAHFLAYTYNAETQKHVRISLLHTNVAIASVDVAHVHAAILPQQIVNRSLHILGEEGRFNRGFVHKHLILFSSYITTPEAKR